MTQSVNEKLDWFIHANASVNLVRAIICMQVSRIAMWAGDWNAYNMPFYIALPFVLLLFAAVVFVLKGLVWWAYDWFWRDHAIEEFAKFVCLKRPEDEQAD